MASDDTLMPTMTVEGFGLVQDRRPHELTTFVTPERDLFRVWHLGIPDVEADRWALRVGGLVGAGLSLSFDDLRSRPQRRVTAIHECAGSPLNPLVPQRRIGNVVWGGVPLRDILGMVRPREGAAYVISRGVDHGRFAGDNYDAYEKDLPLARAMDPDVLVALTINGEPLPIDRGGPVRLVVPGYYGTNSTKWLSQLTLSGKRSPGAFTTRYYMDRETVDGVQRDTPVWAVAPNAILVAPANGALLPPGPTRIWGWAWSDRPVARVDVSIDGGASWASAAVESRRERSWQHFELEWSPRSVGEYVLLARVTDADGNAQPLHERRNRAPAAIVFVRTP